MQLKFGHIADIDAAKGLAKVVFEQDDNLLSKWLPIAVPKTKQDKFSIPFDINEHVYCIMDDECEDGVISGAIYDAGNLPDAGATGVTSVTFGQSIRVEYNRNNATLSITGTGKVEVDITGEAKIKAQKVTIESLTEMELKAASEIKLTAPLVSASALVNVAGVMTAGAIAAAAGGGGGASGDATIGGNLTVVGDVSANEVTGGGKVLSTHTHSGVSTGGGASGPPN